jgi:hypothetical protein
MALGALLWAAGSALWWGGWPVYQVAPWWSGFLVLTIAGERLELARILALRRAALASFLASAGLFLAGLLVSLFDLAAGVRISGAGLLALAAWLGRFDIARRTVRHRGLPRYIAVCLLAGYAWLALAGAGWLAAGGGFAAGPIYDFMLHSLLLGFVMSMIFGHAPIIVPALLGVSVPYSPVFYLPLGALHASLMARLLGDLAALPALRLWGGLLNVAAILSFVAAVALAVRRAQRSA